MEGERETFEVAPLFFPLFLFLFRRRRRRSDGLCCAAAAFAALLRSAAAAACSPSSSAGALAVPRGAAGFGGAVAVAAD